MILRSRHIKEIIRRLRIFEVVAILGPRQIGKTTLAKQVAGRYHTQSHHFDLEDPAALSRLEEDPNLALKDLKGLIIIDEVQRLPDLFPLLRVLSDRRPRPGRFLVLGSASPDLLRQSSESLAGRISYYELNGLGLDEIREGRISRRWLRGGFPSAYLARSQRNCFEWLESFCRTFMERDLAQLGVRTPGATLRRFWAMLAHRHGQTWNSSEFARSFGVADTTVRRYLDILTDTLVVRQLPPWHANLNKRQVKAPKVYLRDSGLAHHLLGIHNAASLDVHPSRGSTWEGLMLELIMEQLAATGREFYHWRTHTGAELDLYSRLGSEQVGIEVKLSSAPAVTPSMRHALRDLNLDELIVVHAGDSSYPLADRIRAVSADRLLTDLPDRWKAVSSGKPRISGGALPPEM